MGKYSTQKTYKRPPYKAWINQPSTLQPYHKHHGKVGIVVEHMKGDMVTIYFTEGPVLSSYIPKICVTPSNKGY